MAKRKATPLFAVAGVVLVGALAYGTIASGGSKVRVADPGGGPVPASTGPEPSLAVSTLPPIGTAAQDPGGGGGGGGGGGNVAPPAIQGAQGSGGAQGVVGGGDTLYFSGVNLLDPNRAATTSGNNTFPTPQAAAGGILAPVTGGTSATGCATDPNSVDYYAIPLKIEHIGFTGAPHVHLRITGSGPVTATLFQQAPNGACQALTSGSSTISGGVANLTMGSLGRFSFTPGDTPAIVVTSPGSHTLSTDSQNPSFLELPGLSGV
jgi:hypothetical protein